ncbi:FAD-dependent oxidoreductase [Marinitenerispora sediminis]|uniref:NAD(P)/FAD-dependent oxidoreductase n=1 Tax=Marinitenerispora sediminis TaxID=1931232 RepID=A0A368SZG3_9ACTN|nr:FAD-dependent oxidoreductase [Marinitenerispora sediminis]RCV47975.1 NAD(P)/FAD-dependent oxidoreductase [Marinitenerispora sediminis]RCV48851.1 NAD(P)/FAD-dependent oxidoreductase [Marinitenerispora sediminis]RCV51210.1 NAD(P)/FAD-dependent oxidoreductase [Marinitenerispora sediminis]
MTDQASDVDVVVIGGGQAGLATSYFLARRGHTGAGDQVVLDRGPGPGGAWQRVWRSVRLISPAAYTRLPGLAWERPGLPPPDGPEVAGYFARYERHFALPVRRPVVVRSVRNDGPGVEETRDTPLLVETDAGTWRARAVVNATGTWDRPFVPAVPGRRSFAGRQLHAAGYHAPEGFAGARVVVVGGGNSAAQILAELSEVTDTVWVTRRPPELRSTAPTEADLVAVTDQVAQRVAAGLPLRSVVSYTGISRTPAVRAAERRGALAALPMFDRITAGGVAWADGRTERADVILWATGFRPVLAHLGPLRLRDPRGGIRLVGTRTAPDPRVHLVGYGPSASMISAHRAAAAAAREVLAERTARV